MFHILCHIEISGLENVPLGSSYIIAHNHISLFEPPLVLSFWPEIPEAIAGADVFERPGQKIMVRAYRAIPVHRGEYDRLVIDTMLEVLTVGRPLLIAPEGGRSHVPGLRRARAGVAYLVDRANVPVVPVGIIGTTDDLLKRALRGKRPRLQMNIGKPFSPPPIAGRGKQRREARQGNADMVMERIAELIPEAYRGVYR
ncbi:MAG: lysophospholipid acyltransferase family protein [Chloroflexi bacterium]|nr:lysophospholipid acyltransferase family protein [Chloroflexota bacterium]